MARKRKRKANDTRLSAKSNIGPVLLLFVCMAALIGVIVGVSYLTLGETSSDTGIGQVYINEVMTSNKGTLMAPDGSVGDWVELYNNSSKKLNVSGYALALQTQGSGSNSPLVFPDGTEIDAGGYLIVYCNNSYLSEYLCAPFSLSKAGGETLVLKNSDGTSLDSVTTEKMTSNSVMMRTDYEAGSWTVSGKPTPGYPNTDEGYEALAASRRSENVGNTIVINEVQCKNTVGVADADGDRNDWIEIKNISDSSVDLNYYSLGSSLSAPYEWQFPAITLGAGKTLLVYCSGKDISEISGELHTNFSLKTSNVCVTVSDASGKIIDSVGIAEIAPDASYARDGSGNYTETFSPTPGYENSEEGFRETGKLLVGEGGLVIYEAMSKNSSYIPQNGGRYYDWVELKNTSSEEIDLSAYCLSNDADVPDLYALPERKLGAGESIVIICSGNSVLSNSGYYHANFKINGDEQIYLFRNGEFVDGACLKGTKIGTSLTRVSDRAGFWTNTSPSPKTTEGDQVYYAVAAEPNIETASGVFTDVGTVTVSISGEGDIYYTLDGSDPTVYSKKYTGPFEIAETKSVRAVSYSAGKIRSRAAAATYVINEGDTLPVMPLCVDNDDLYSQDRGIYATGYYASSEFPYLGANFWQPWERECTAEFFENGDGFSVDCGIRIFGAYSRADAKKSFQLKFRDMYGQSELVYPVFDELDTVKSFKALVLRSGSQDYGHAMLRDEFFTSLLKAHSDSIFVQAYKSCVLYINGEYFGIYYFREKVNSDYVAKHMNADETQTSLLVGSESVVYGSREEFQALRSFVETHDMADPENYKYAEERIDFVSLIDFTIGEYYSGNQDNGNAKWFMNGAAEDTRWKWIYYDLDWGFYYDTPLDFYLRKRGQAEYGFAKINALIGNLLDNPDFRALFLERMAYHLKNTFSEEVALAHLQGIVDQIEPDMKKECERWDKTYSRWENEVEKVRNFIRSRKDFMLPEIKAWFGISQAEYDKYFGDLG